MVYKGKRPSPERCGRLYVRAAALAVNIADLLCVLPLVLFRKGLEALHNDASIVAVVHVDTRGSHPCLQKSTSLQIKKTIKTLFFLE
jgi:hypothetical protein